MSHSQNSKRLEAALEYSNQYGWSIIPANIDKQGLVKWTINQEERASDEQINSWWTNNPNANVAAVTGKKSGFFVVDVDVKNNIDGHKSLGYIPLTASSKTGSGGTHYFFKHPGFPVINKASILPGVDIRGDGGIVILPPSQNRSGPYSWMVTPTEGIADAPDWLLSLLKEDRHEEKKWKKNLMGAPEGERNDTAASMAGKILHGLAPELHEVVGWESLKAWNRSCEKPLGEKELRAVWNSISKKNNTPATSSQKTNKADEIIDLICSNEHVAFFKSELDEPYIQFPVGNHKEYYQFKNKKVRWWLSKYYHEQKGSSIRTEPLNNALNTLQGIAAFGDVQHTLSNRIAKGENCYYYSLTDKDWRAIKITDNTWSLEKNPPILFRRYSHQAPQVEPISGGNPWKIFEYINISDKNTQLLVIIWLATGLIAGFGKPIIYLYGPQGSAKSSASRILKRILDPSQLEVSEIPKDQAGLAQKLQHHACIIFDNVSHINNEMSDILCRAVTGSGFTKREHYSDDDDIIYTFRRSMGINGINLNDMNPDLLERSILIQLERVSEERRISEQELWDRFSEDLPLILGGLFDAVSKALPIYPTVNITRSPRMADFARWGYAISEALGYKGDDFLNIYWKNINKQHEQVVEDNIIASFIIDLLDKTSVWEGTASELLHEMEEHDEYKKRIKEIPKAANSLSRKLNVVKSNLEALGISIERDESSTHKKIIIRKAGQNIESIDTPVQTGLLDDDF